MKFNNRHSLKNYKKKSLEYMSIFLFEKTYKKGDFVLRRDDIFRNILFVKSGAVHQHNSDSVILTNIYNQNDMICSAKAFKQQQCFGSDLIALEDTTLFCFSFYNYKKICLAYPRFEYTLGLMIANFNLLKMNLFLGITSDLNFNNKKYLNKDNKVIFLENIFQSCA